MFEKEAEEYVCKRNPLVTKEWFIDAFKKYNKGEKVKYLKDCEIAEYEAYLAGAEPREKRIKELEEKISVLLSCKNCPENKGGYICEKEYENKCLSQKIQFIKELQEENAEAKNLIYELASSLSVVGECDEEECELINRAQKFINKPIF